MKDLNYYRELIELIERKGNELEFRNLYNKYFNVNPPQEMVIQFLIEVNEDIDEEDESYESSYDESYEESYEEDDEL